MKKIPCKWFRKRSKVIELILIFCYLFLSINLLNFVQFCSFGCLERHPYVVIVIIPFDLNNK